MGNRVFLPVLPVSDVPCVVILVETAFLMPLLCPHFFPPFREDPALRFVVL